MLHVGMIVRILTTCILGEQVVLHCSWTPLTKLHMRIWLGPLSMFGACLESSMRARESNTTIGEGNWVNSAQAVNEVIFESLDGSFGSIDSMFMRFHQLPAYILR